MRTQVLKLIDYIKASAVLHQLQREKNEDGQLISGVRRLRICKILIYRASEYERRSIE